MSSEHDLVRVVQSADPVLISRVQFDLDEAGIPYVAHNMSSGDYIGIPGMSHHALSPAILVEQRNFERAMRAIQAVRDDAEAVDDERERRPSVPTRLLAWLRGYVRQR